MRCDSGKIELLDHEKELNSSYEKIHKDSIPQGRSRSNLNFLI